MELTIEILKTAYSDIHAAVLKEGYDKGLSEGMAKGRDEGFKAGSDQERSRIKGIEDGALPGHEDLVSTMKWDGKTTPEQAAVKILHAEKTMRDTKLESFQKDAPPVVPAVDPAKNEPATVIDGNGPMTEQQMKAKWDGDPKLQAEFAGDFEAFKAFAEAEQHGLVKIYKGGK
ncbi:MAG: hypothetical protein ABFD12_08710 [Syntrophorhabdus sp.]